MNEKLKILIVDDDLMMARTLKDIFSMKGFYADIAHSGLEALKKVKENLFGFILSDIKMPDMNGVEFYRSVKSLFPFIPVVLMTAYTCDNLVREGLGEGVLSVIDKPLDIKLLLKFLSIMEKRRNIFILHDSPEFCEDLAENLRICGFYVKEAMKAEYLIENISGDTWLVLLNINLPGTYVFTVYKKLKEKHPAVPVFFLTAYENKFLPEMEDAINNGVSACFYKPCDSDEVLNKLSSIYHSVLRSVFL